MLNSKVILIVSCLLVLLGVSTAGAAELPLIFSEDWDTSGGQLPAIWQVLPRSNSSDTPAVSSDQAFSGKYSLSVWRTAGAINMTNWVAIQFPTVPEERLVVSFSLWASDKERSLALAFSGNDLPINTMMGGEAGPFLALRSGALQSYVTAYVDQGIITPQTWYRVTLDIDVKNRCYDVYLDGVQQNFDPISYRNNSLEKLTAIGFGFHAASAAAGYKPVYIDDLEIRGY
jgi:hypothetical protein